MNGNFKTHITARQERIHEGTRLLQCDVCSSFKNKHYLKSHIEHIHEEKGPLYVIIATTTFSDQVT